MRVFHLFSAFSNMARWCHCQHVILVFLAILSAVFLKTANMYAGQTSTALSSEHSNHNIVFVIDTSTSMYDIIDDLRKAMRDYVKESRPGDSIAIITFGRSSKLLYRRTIRGKSDIEKILKFCKELSCPDDYTYIGCGLVAGVRELLRFYRVNPDGTFQLVLMSDGVNNPPPGLDGEIEYADIEEEFFSYFEPGKDWFITYFALKGIKDKKLAAFVEKWGGFYWDPEKLKHIAEVQIDSGLPIEDNILSLGSAVLPVRRKIPLYVSPVKGKSEGMAIKVEPLLIAPSSNAKLLINTSPSIITCAAMRAREEITLSLTGCYGNEIRGALRFTPAEKSFLIVHPTQIRFVFAKPPMFVISSNASLDVGPLTPGGEPAKKRLPLQVDGILPTEGLSVHAIPEIELPEGITCNVSVALNNLPGQQPYISVTALASEDVSYDSEWVGELVLANSSASSVFSRDAVPLKVFTSRPLEAETSRIWYILAILSVFVVFLSGLLCYRAYKKRFIPAEGWLVVLEKPKQSRLPNIDFNTLSRKLKKTVLILGSAPSCDIHLPHESVGQRHARFRSSKRMTTTCVHIRSLGLSDVKINNYIIDEEIQLNDRDIIDIGEYQFIYSNSHMKQVVVHYKDGDIKYGIPLTWNIEDRGFVLRPEGEGADKLQVYIPFKDLKGVFFVKDFDKEIARKMAHTDIYARKDHLVVRFRDGEKIEGYTIQHYDQKAARFFLAPKIVPGKDENNIFILVERKFTRRIQILNKAEHYKK